MLKKSIGIINDAQKTISRLSEDFNDMSKRNKQRSSSINKELESKSMDFKTKKQSRSKHFDSIRNK
ncbi:hypothetical protein ACFVP8_04120 [Viridibacillus arvi]|uniref:hypothetical protein n=1 Tax=Viridibacillus arvi TaxID=263475 RepID=UPI0036A89EAF